MDTILGTVPEETLAAARFGLSSLTPREREVLKQIIAGYTASDSAADLGISRRTVELHRQSVLSKLGARNLVSAVRLVALVDIGRLAAIVVGLGLWLLGFPSLQHDLP